MANNKPTTRIKNAQRGDVYEIPLDSKTKAYMQFIMLDDETLSAEVVRVFEEKYDIAQPVDLRAVVEGKVAFYIHTWIRSGVKDGVFSMVGNIEINEDITPSFRSDRSVENHYPGRVSDEWHVWKLGGSAKKIGRLTAKYRHLDTGGTYPPTDIVYRLIHGKSEFVEAD